MTDMILIYDDVRSPVDAWRERLLAIPEVKRAFEVQGVDDSEFIRTFEELKARSTRARNGQTKDSNGEVAFDAASILVIDFDLLRLNHPAYLTGETIAYLARCYSRCGIIVALNQFGDNTFDLTLRGHPESYADLNIGGRQLDNRGLWVEPWNGFRPWQWPLLPEAYKAFRKRVEEVETRLDTPIAVHLRLSESVVRTLPHVARDFLTKNRAIEPVTFRDFALDSGQGFKSRDKPLGDEHIARVAAARLAQWVESHLLPGQDILVDAPHLAYRYPSLLVGDAGGIESWNRTATLAGREAPGVRVELLERFAFPREWVSRPTWSWNDISTSESIAEVKDPWSIHRPEWVFCEDLSQFVPAEAAREFMADVESPFARRYISRPQSGVLARLRQELEAIDYRPQDRLYL